MGGMTQSLWAIINVWRQMGIVITDEDAEDVRQLCVRKMEAAQVEDPDGYLPLLYADEVKWKLVFGKTVNALSASRMEESMCSECHSWPHLPGCPNAPDPVPVMTCSLCGEGILEGDEYLNGPEGPVCGACLDNMSLKEVLAIFGESLSVAQGGY